MGSVAMEEINLGFRVHGYMATQIAYCVYCDECGSFNIRKRIAIKVAFWISAVAVVAILLLAIGLPSKIIVFFGLPVFILGLILENHWKFRQKCNKCGNVTKICGNILNYPENDRSILDIPYEATSKYYRDG